MIDVIALRFGPIDRTDDDLVLDFRQFAEREDFEYFKLTVGLLDDSLKQWRKVLAAVHELARYWIVIIFLTVI